jgi:hypothetical protein
MTAIHLDGLNLRLGILRHVDLSTLEFDPSRFIPYMEDVHALN